MANYLSDRTGASIDTVLDNADAGNIGKSDGVTTSEDFNLIDKSGFFGYGGNANAPDVVAGSLLNIMRSTSFGTHRQSQLTIDQLERISFRRKTGSTWSAWQELYHTGNTSVVTFGGATPPSGGSQEIVIGRGNAGLIETSRTVASSEPHYIFINPNGQVGSISTSGTATAYNTSSDPRLKDFASAPSDSDINTEFDKVFSCFRTFNWKSDPTGDLVWGFDAWAAIDSGAGFGSEGEGSRSLNIGDVYETIPAVTESRVVMDSDGNPTTQIEEVIVTPAIDKKVTPAGVDQSKITSVLLAKIEQLERRLTAAGL